MFRQLLGFFFLFASLHADGDPHDKEKPEQIESFDEDGHLYAVQKFFWKNSLLQGQALMDPEGQGVIAKTFTYDATGNIEEEILWGNLTGKKNERFKVTPEGTLHQADSYWKRYKYLANYPVPVLEEEENGPTYRYVYKTDTDVLEAKFTYEGTRILKREFWLYDDVDRLMVEIVDDGSSEDTHNLTGVTERHIKRVENNSSGLPEKISTYYLEEGMEKLLRSITYTHSSHGKVETETVFDAQGEERYTIRMEYNAQGDLLSRTDPLGQKKHYTSDDLGRCIPTDAVGVSMVMQDDHRQGRKIYDLFGRCKQIELPTLRDENNDCYVPIIQYAYDLHGNLALETNARGEQLRMLYTAYRKPYHILQPDGSEIHHRYHKNGTLAHTRLPDGTEIQYDYDIFQRVTRKKIVASTQEVLSEEIWVYNTFHLICYTNPRGLTTLYTYDKAGRLIHEKAEGREKYYTYDALGFLERTSDGVTTHVELHDVMGQVSLQWKEDRTGKRENHTTYTYRHHQKDTIRRQTSQGEALDQFFYDHEGRLERHVDPLGHASQFIFEVIVNDLGQNVWTKKWIEANGNTTLETYDIAGRVVRLQCFSKQGEAVSEEQIFYDRAGNKAKVTHTVHQGTIPFKTVTTTWIHDSMGKVVQEIEAEQKTTSYRYFPQEAKEEKILPNGTILTAFFDGLQRPLELKSSDGSVHLRYTYHSQQSCIQICDLVHHCNLERHYNLFGELIEENAGRTWSYDAQGRCTTFTLLGIGTIRYNYEGMHLTSVERLSTNGALLYTHHYTQFDPNGHVEEEELLGGIGRIVTSHDLLERPCSQKSCWLNQIVRYGPSGLVMETQNSLFGTKRYDYDPLNQILKDAETTYPFDSLGNRTDSVTNNILHYDLNGNPNERITPQGMIKYQYDPLGRLTEISCPDKNILYAYDPLSRLYSKEVMTPTSSTTVYYLYDKEREIGTVDQNGTLLELKVLGLGILGEIGATIAIELEGEVFAPLHDFRGNIIALLASDGNLAESSDFDAFGLESNLAERHRNPWRFSSKRSEETGLIFFGLRFYDPLLQRFLTPDPSGFADGPNLYAYNRNNPLGRLDLLGLSSENFLVPLRIDVSTAHFQSTSNFSHTIFPCKFVCPDNTLDGFVSCGAFRKLQFSPIETEQGTVNILTYLDKLVAHEGKVISIFGKGNGIDTTLEELREMFMVSIANISEGTFAFAVYNPSKGFLKDSFRVFAELVFKIETSIVRDMRYVLMGISERLAKINKDGIFAYSMHSENGLIVNRAYEKMPKAWQDQINANVLFAAYNPVLPIPDGVGKSAVNLYSENDSLSLAFKLFWKSNVTYNIQMVECITKWHEKFAFLYDHAFLAPTGQQAIRNLVKDWRKDYGFHAPATR